MQRRLDELRDAGLADLAAGSGYSLTSLGKGLIEAVQPLSSFVDKWSKR